MIKIASPQPLSPRYELQYSESADPGFCLPTNEPTSADDENNRRHSLRRPTYQKRTLVRQMVLFVLLVSSLSVIRGVALAQGSFNGDTQGCSVDQPCFNGNYQRGNAVLFEFTGTCCWDFYNVRYLDAGGSEKQVENKTGKFTFTDVKPSTRYRISVQGCKSHVLGHSTCTEWVQSSVTTEAGLKSSLRVLPRSVGTPPPPAAPAEPVKTIGRVNVHPSQPGSSSRPASGQLPICDAARSARSRNSPVAPQLEVQCRAQGGDPSPLATSPVPSPAPTPAPPAEPPNVTGRTDVLPSPPARSSQPMSRPVRICDAARSARSRNSPMTPQLEARCLAQGGDPSPLVPGAVDVNPGSPAPSPLDLAAKGSVIVSDDALLTTMSGLEREGARRLGFDVGVAIGADQTLWTHSSQAMIDSLPESERPSAEKSAHFVMVRNANAKLAADGARIAQRESRDEFIAARAAEPAGYYTLGFDIAAGLFGSIKRGGAGQTLPGTGTAAVRNSMPPPGQRGFDVAMSLYMER